MNGSQSFKPVVYHFHGENRETSLKAEGRVVTDIPNLITKKWLYCHFEISRSHPNGLYRNILTSEVLEELGLSINQVRTPGFRVFSATQSRKLIQILFG